MKPQEQRATFLEAMRAGIADSNAAVERAKSELDALLREHRVREQYDDFVSRIGVQPPDVRRIECDFGDWLETMPRVDAAFRRFQALDRLLSRQAYTLDRVESEDMQ